MFRRAILLSVTLFVAACSPIPEPSHEAAVDLFPELRIIARSGTGVAYAFYESHVDRFHEEHILFFGSHDDLFSQRSDRVLQSAYGSGAAKYPAYNIDFATSTGSRLSYGVFVPDTIVLVSGTGARVLSVIHPTETELRNVIRGMPTPSARR